MGKVSAVKTNRVSLSPVYPFGWIERSPSINLLIGLKWMAHLIHPELFPLDLAVETRAFYELFYHVKLSDAHLERLLKSVRSTRN